jgi:hypothetical protein
MDSIILCIKIPTECNSERLLLAGGDKHLLQHVTALPPTSWSKIDRSASLELEESGMCVRYIGKLISVVISLRSVSLIDSTVWKDADNTTTKTPAAAVRANHPIPPGNSSFYFEITILDNGENGYAWL